MAIKLAFSTVACPDWTIEQVADHAKAIGYQGVELRTLGPGGSTLASDPALSGAKRVRDALADRGVEPVCLTTGLYAHHRDRSADREAYLQIEKNLELAAEIGCPFVQAFAGKPAPNQDRRTIIQQMAKSAGPLAQRAADLGLTLILENEPAFSVPKEWWWLLETASKPSLGICWNLPNAASANRNDNGGAVAIPTLNSRIRMVKLYDAIIGPAGGFTPIGEGSIELELSIQRLMGIGFQGYLSVEWNRLWFDSLTGADEFLPQAYERLRGWIDAILAGPSKGKKNKTPPAKQPATAGT